MSESLELKSNIKFFTFNFILINQNVVCSYFTYYQFWFLSVSLNHDCRIFINTYSDQLSRHQFQRQRTWEDTDMILNFPHESLKAKEPILKMKNGYMSGSLTTEDLQMVLESEYGIMGIYTREIGETTRWKGQVDSFGYL